MKLTKIVIVIFLIFCNKSTYSQKNSISINYKPSLTYFGKQKQSFSNSQFISRSGNNTFHNAVNIMCNFQVYKKFAISAGLEYAQQGQNVNFKEYNIDSENKNKIYVTKFNYLRIPIVVNYKIYKNNKNEMLVYSGVSLGFAKKIYDNYNGIIWEMIMLPPANKRYNSKDVAIPLGLNYKTNITKNIKSNIGFEYMFGLTNAFSNNSSSTFGVLSQFKNSKQNRLSLNFGLTFNLSKTKK